MCHHLHFLRTVLWKQSESRVISYTGCDWCTPAGPSWSVLAHTIYRSVVSDTDKKLSEVEASENLRPFGEGNKTPVALLWKWSGVYIKTFSKILTSAVSFFPPPKLTFPSLNCSQLSEQHATLLSILFSLGSFLTQALFLFSSIYTHYCTCIYMTVKIF